MATPNADRNLLFGILALQMDFISRDALIAAMHAWVLDKARPLAEILVVQKALAPNRRAMLEPLVEEHIKQHGNDAEKSLASVSSVGSLRDQLKQIADPDIQASVEHVAVNREADPFPTRTETAGELTSAGQRFRILRPHAMGGLGEVFVARDEELHREVALKQIQDCHADDARSRARFLLEAEVTGGLEHPGVVPVYGLGKYPDGRPFYAMRFVKGDSLKDAIERFYQADASGRDPGEWSLEFRKLLGRFIDVCNAVGYAHSRGVLHRDLKPGNVLLGPYGETLVVDWGLAKVVGRPEEAATQSEGTLRPSAASGSAPTEMGSAVGTPQYMSPEQAAGRLDEMSLATDVYSLGAVLYSLLTGKAPFAGTHASEVLERVRKGDFLPPRRINPNTPAALEAICLKAMALRPEGRYSSARALADDIEHWLADEPVSAYADPWRERARRWRSRHRTLVTAAAASLIVAVVALASGLFLLALANNRERELRREAAAERDEALRQRERALQAEGQAKQSEAEARAVLDFFKDKVLAAARPKGQEGGLGREATIRAAVDAAEPQIGKAFADQPAVEASVRGTLGLTYGYLGEPALAIVQQERALSLRQKARGPDHPDTLDSMNNLATAYDDAGRRAEALLLYEETLKLAKAKLGPDHRDTLKSMNNVASAYGDAGRLTEALPLYQETLKRMKAKLGPEHPYTLSSMSGFATACERAGDLAKSEALCRELVPAQRRKLGPEHPDTAEGLAQLGQVLLKQQKHAEAEPLLRESMAVWEKKRPEDWRRFWAMGLLGAVLLGQRQYAAAESLLLQADAGMHQRDSQIPVPAKTYMAETRARLVTLYDAWGKKGQAAEWRKKEKEPQPTLPAKKP